MTNTLNRWLVYQLPHLIELASLPFEQDAHEDYCERIGWEAFREDWYPETGFEVRFEEVERRLLAIYDEMVEEVGIGLYVLGYEPGEGSFTTTEEFDEAFRTTLATIEPKFETAAIRGTYRYGEGLFHYAYWIIGDTFLTLVQHHEGDAHSGNDCSLDVRLLPRRGSNVLKFPLVTNMLF